MFFWFVPWKWILRRIRRESDVLVWEDAGVLWKNGILSDEGVFVFRGKGWDWPKIFGGGEGVCSNISGGVP